MVNWPKQRAWGWYATLIRTPWFCVKLLRFKPYGRLSVQKHTHRTEIWLLIKGRGKFQSFIHSDVFFFRGVEKLLPIKQSGDVVKIRREYWHRFIASEEPVYVLELQYGRKVTESDIERK